MENYIKPDFTLFNRHDIIISDENFNTPVVSNYNYRNYICISEGSMKLRFVSHKYNDVFKSRLDYELLQNISTYDVIKNNDKINVLELDVKKDDIIFIPSRWWYSIQFNEPGVIIKYQYRTPMNIFAHIPYYVYSYMAVTKSLDNKKKKKYKNIIGPENSKKSKDIKDSK